MQCVPTDRPLGRGEGYFYLGWRRVVIQKAFGMTTNPRIKDMAAKDRPRERLAADGAEALSNADLVAILLRTGMKGYSAIHIAQQLLARFGTLEELARASLDQLRQVKGVGRDKAIALKSAFTLAQRMARELQQEAPVLDTPERIADLLREENRLRVSTGPIRVRYESAGRD